MALWEIDLLVEGPVMVREQFVLQEQKGHDPEDPFFSTVTVSRHAQGLAATVEARADAQELAYKAAFIFFGRMLDTLALSINEPLVLKDGRWNERSAQRRPNRRIVRQEEVAAAFADVRRFRGDERTFLRSLSWFRKALSTEDRFDQFLAYWNSIELVSASNFTRVPGMNIARATEGSKNQIWGCFNAMWPNAEKWRDADDRNRWLDINHQLRNEIAHGITDVTIEKVEEVSTRLRDLRRIAHEFLLGWRDQMLGRLLAPHQPPASA